MTMPSALRKEFEGLFSEVDFDDKNLSKRILGEWSSVNGIEDIISECDGYKHLIEFYSLGLYLRYGADSIQNITEELERQELDMTRAAVMLKRKRESIEQAARLWSE